MEDSRFGRREGALSHELARVGLPQPHGDVAVQTVGATVKGGQMGHHGPLVGAKVHADGPSKGMPPHHAGRHLVCRQRFANARLAPEQRLAAVAVESILGRNCASKIANHKTNAHAAEEEGRKGLRSVQKKAI